jgi:flagellar hook-basal body complex protein FliE
MSGTLAGASAGGAAASAPFGDLLKNAIDGVDGLEQQATSAVQGVLSGSGVDVHEAMIATQKADLSFEMALAVRNKAVAAYQQVMGMQF